MAFAYNPSASFSSVPTGPTSSGSQVDQFNYWLRNQPWYQNFFASQGLNPNRVQLSDTQRGQLAQLLASNGLTLPDGMTIDPAGNLNTQHGFASLPTWAKIGIGAGAAATGFGLAGLGPLGGMLGLGDAGAAAAGGAGAIPLAGAPSVAGAAGIGGTGAAAAGGGSTIGSLLGLGGSSGGFPWTSLIGPAIGAATGILTTRAQGSAADKALQAQIDAAKYSADTTAKTAANQLAFEQQQAQLQQQNFLDTQAKNYALYQAAQARMQPYRALGTNALTQLQQPITVGSVTGLG